MTNPKPTLKVVDEGESEHQGMAPGGDQPTLPIPEPGKSRPAAIDRSLAGFDIGVVLRQNRLKQRKDLDEIATALCIRRDYLEAIEDGRNQDLPGPTYALGFLRAYAEYLGLNGDDAINRYKGECTDIDWDSRTGPPAARNEKGRSAGAMLVGGVLVAAVAYGAWHFLSGSDDGAAEEAKVADTAAPAQDTENAAEGAPEGTVATTKSDATPAAAAEEKPAEQSVAAAQSETEKKVAEPAPKPKAEAPKPPEAVKPAPKPKKVAGGGRGGPVVLTMTDDSWMQIRDSKGAVLLTRLMRKGQSYEVPKERKGLTLLIGNSGAVQISVGEQQLPALGAKDVVGRDIPLDAEKLLARLSN